MALLTRIARTVLLNDHGHEVADIVRSIDGRYTLRYGEMYWKQESFPTIPDAISWAEAHEAEIIDSPLP
jgi:hypothetical protein